MRRSSRMSKIDTDRFALTAQEAMSQDSSSSTRFDAMQIPAYGLTISPTWLWAIMHAGKDVENRSPRDRRRLEKGIGEVVALTASLRESHQREQQARDAIRKNSTTHPLMRLPGTVDHNCRSRRARLSIRATHEAARLPLQFCDARVLGQPSLCVRLGLQQHPTQSVESVCVIK